KICAPLMSTHRPMNTTCKGLSGLGCNHLDLSRDAWPPNRTLYILVGETLFRINRSRTQDACTCTASTVSKNSLKLWWNNSLLFLNTKRPRLSNGSRKLAIPDASAL